RRLRRRAYHHRGARRNPGRSPEQGAGSRLHNHLRRGRRAAHHLGRGHRNNDEMKHLLESHSRNASEKVMKKSSTSRARQQALLKLSPFELKDELIKLAEVAERDDVAQFLDAGRGNPNWICTTPRDAYGTLLRFGLEESRRDVTIPDTGR